METNWRGAAVIDSGYNVAGTAESSVLARTLITRTARCLRQLP